MKESHLNDQALEDWAKHRRANAGAGLEFTRDVIERIRIEAAEPSPRDLPAPRLRRVTLAAACAIADIGKFLILVHLAI